MVLGAGEGTAVSRGIQGARFSAAFCTLVAAQGVQRENPKCTLVRAGASSVGWYPTHELASES